MSGDTSMSGDSNLEAMPSQGVDPTGISATPALDPPQEAGSDQISDQGPNLAGQLAAELAALKAEHESLNGQYMRLAADFDNFRKRQSRDSEDLRLQITCSTLGEILPVVDNFDRARQQLNPQHEEAQALHRSYQGLYKQLVDVFKQLGVSPMRVEGEPFDPSLHEAVLREPSEAHAEDVVIEELQRGYHLNGRVLRHALVKVSMGPGSGAVSAGTQSAGSQTAENGQAEEQDG
jgi:molecular chaperone GrpE